MEKYAPFVERFSDRTNFFRGPGNPRHTLPVGLPRRALPGARRPAAHSYRGTEKSGRCRPRNTRGAAVRPPVQNMSNTNFRIGLNSLTSAPPIHPSLMSRSLPPRLSFHHFNSPIYPPPFPTQAARASPLTRLPPPPTPLAGASSSSGPARGRNF